MKAAIYTQYGPPEVLRLAEVEKPVPRDNEVLIRVHASSVTAADFRCRSFTVPWSFWVPARLALGILGPRQPILGVELAGEVEDIGKGVTRFKKGDRVFAAAIVRPGGYAEYTCLAEVGVIATMPVNMTYEEAAAVPVGARAALHFLKKANIKRGQKVLVYGASGSVGTFAVQIAKYFGAEVTGVCSGANVELVKSLGADHVIDYTKENFADRGAGWDVVFVAVDKARFADCLKALKRHGIYLDATTPLRTVAMRWAALTSGRTIVTGEHPPQGNSDDLVFLRGLIEQGALRPAIDRIYPLEQIVEAHRYVDLGHKKGNVVIRVG